MIIKSNTITKLLGVRGIMLFPFIIVIRKPNKILLNHERIHYVQCKELMILGFYVIYIAWFAAGILRYWSWSKAYQMVPFEKEAYFFQSDPQYLKNRKRFAWRLLA